MCRSPHGILLGGAASRSAPNSRMVSSSRYRGLILLGRSTTDLSTRPISAGRISALVQGTARADRFDGRMVERAGEHRQPGPEELLGRRAQVVAPLGRRCGVSAGAAGAARRPPVNIAKGWSRRLGELAEARYPQLNGGQLDGQRDAVEPLAQPRRRRPRFASVTGEAGRGRRGALGEQLDRVAAACRAGREPAAAVSGTVLARARRAAAAHGQQGDPRRLAQQRARPAPRTRRSGARRVEDEEQR